MTHSVYTKLFNDARSKDIWEKISNRVRIDDTDALYLFSEADLGTVATMANWIREDRHGDLTYFNRNIHIEPTNVCIYDCKFCSYSRMIKNRTDGWEYSMDQMLDIFKKQAFSGISEVHIVGGVLPQYDLTFYEQLFSAIKEINPQIHIKSLTPVELFYIFKKAKVSTQEGFIRLKKAGLDSLPGGGAEIFNDAIRKQICADKCSTEDWLAIHQVWHEMGGKSNATILYGHIESYPDRIDHMSRLRSLQDKTGGFQTFIPLKFRNKDNEMSYLPEVTSLEDMRNYAVSRIYLDNFAHIKSYWPMLGRDMAQLSLSYGVDDLDGTIDDTTKIYSMAGSEEQHPAMTTNDLVMLIQKASRKPIERDTMYHIIKEYNEPMVNSHIRSYFALPVVNN